MFCFNAKAHYFAQSVVIIARVLFVKHRSGFVVK
jgi:hypothetical protein